MIFFRMKMKCPGFTKNLCMISKHSKNYGIHKQVVGGEEHNASNNAHARPGHILWATYPKMFCLLLYLFLSFHTLSRHKGTQVLTGCY